MKSIKTTAAMAVASLFVFASSAQAEPSGTVIFTGAVTAATCDTVIGVDGVPYPSFMIDVGTVVKGATGDEKPFEIISTAVGGGECAATGTADVMWSSPSMSANGIDNHTGAATGSHVVLKSKPTSGTAVTVSTGNLKTSFSNADIKAGMEFTAQLVGGDTAGDFYATATYDVVYF